MCYRFVLTELGYLDKLKNVRTQYRISWSSDVYQNLSLRFYSFLRTEHFKDSVGECCGHGKFTDNQRTRHITQWWLSIKCIQIQNDSKYRAAILFVIEDVTYNICDQRFHEFEIKRQNPKARVVRKTLTEIGQLGRLDENKRLFV